MEWLQRVFRIFSYCSAAIRGEENPDVRHVLRERPIEITRAAFFPEAVWAIMVSGIGRRSAAPHAERATLCGFPWDYRLVASWTDDAWSLFLAQLYPYEVSGRGRMKWAAIRWIADLLNSFADEESFRREFFNGKFRSAELNGEDVRRLASKGLPWIQRRNAQLIVKNMGGEAIKCDRWIGELLAYLGITLMELERALVEAGISLSLFDVTIWAYCEAFIRKFADLAPHFDRVLDGGHGPELGD